MLSTVTERTMSSVDLVALINKIRKEENPTSAVLRHNDFMAKILKVLGAEAARRFSHSYIGADNTSRPCYNLPKRECHLMVMSESYKVQAAVYDRMEALEAQLAPKIGERKISDPVLAALVETLIRLDQVEQEHLRLTENQKHIESRIDQISTAVNYFTILGWCKHNGVTVSLNSASAMGKRASKECRKRNIEISVIPDPRFGQANTYPKSLLDELFGDI